MPEISRHAIYEDEGESRMDGTMHLKNDEDGNMRPRDPRDRAAASSGEVMISPDESS